MKSVYRTVIANLWRSPIRTFTVIDYFKLHNYHTTLFVLAGIVNVLNRNFIKLSDHRNNLLSNLLSSVLIGALAGWLGLLLFSGLVYLTGKWLKGQANFSDISNTVAYATLPCLVSLGLTICGIALLRLLGFEYNTYYYQYMQSWHYTSYGIIAIHRYINYALNFYYFVLVFAGLSVAQHYSITKSVINVLLAIGMIALPLALFIIVPYLTSR
ncbi:YIP1 family protein [Mucilaginibacter sp.]